VEGVRQDEADGEQVDQGHAQEARLVLMTCNSYILVLIRDQCYDF
jgi:hypothetical protein